MDRYRKAWIAVAGFVATLLAALDQALDVGIVPESWRPWLVVAITAATALGVERVPNTAPRWAATRRRDDTGAASPRLLAVFLAVAGLVTVALAGDAQARPGPAPHIRVTSASKCDGTLAIGYGIETFHRGAWDFQQDRGDVRVELHHIGSGAGPGGHWDPPANAPFRHVEGHFAVRVVAEPTWDAVRVILPDPGWGDVASSQALATARCPA